MKLLADYYKLTGVNFPVNENITDYFLSIPNVMAYCTEQGSRIFNILPLDKTRHLYNMILKQKPPNKDMGYNQYHSNKPKKIKTTRCVRSYLASHNNHLEQQNISKEMDPCNSKQINSSYSEIGMDSVNLDSNEARKEKQTNAHGNITKKSSTPEIVEYRL